MATSGVSTWQIQRSDLIESALRKVGAIEQGVSPSTDQVTEGSMALNAIVKEWQNVGVIITLREIATKAIAGTTGSFNPSADTIDVLSASITAGGYDRPVRVISAEEWEAWPDKTNAGLPQVAHFDGVNTIYLGPPAKDAMTFNYERVRQVEDFVNPTDDMDLPPRWARALIYALAADLSDEYGVSIEERKYLSERAEFYLGRAAIGQTSGPENKSRGGE